MGQKRKKNRSRAVDFIKGALREMARDPEIAGATRLKAIDRLAVIDKIYDVEIAEPSDKNPLLPSELPVVMPTIDEEAQRMLAEWKKKFEGEVSDAAKH